MRNDDKTKTVRPYSRTNGQPLPDNDRHKTRFCGAVRARLQPVFHPVNQVEQDAATRDRTGDLQIFSLTLSQLSYLGRAPLHQPAQPWETCEMAKKQRLSAPTSVSDCNTHTPMTNQRTIATGQRPPMSVKEHDSSALPQNTILRRYVRPTAHEEMLRVRIELTTLGL